MRAGTWWDVLKGGKGEMREEDRKDSKDTQAGREMHTSPLAQQFRSDPTLSSESSRIYPITLVNRRV